MLQPRKVPDEFSRDNELYISHFKVQKPKTNFKQRFLVHSGEKLIPVSSKHVAFFYAEDRWTYLITHDNVRYLVDHTLKELESMMHPDEYFRVNRSYLVSNNAIMSLRPYLKGQLKVRLKPAVEEEVIVSRAKTPQLKHWLDQ